MGRPREGRTYLGRRDWTLRAIAMAGGEPLSPVQLQKSLFNYGPFDSIIYHDAERLAEEGLVFGALEEASEVSYAVLAERVVVTQTRGSEMHGTDH